MSVVPPVSGQNKKYACLYSVLRYRIETKVVGGSFKVGTNFRGHFRTVSFRKEAKYGKCCMMLDHWMRRQQSAFDAVDSRSRYRLPVGEG